jgi:hypothetical protein
MARGTAAYFSSPAFSHVNGANCISVSANIRANGIFLHTGSRSIETALPCGHTYAVVVLLWSMIHA